MGPFPGNIDQASFFAFYYDKEDVLCLGTFKKNESFESFETKIGSKFRPIR